MSRGGARRAEGFWVPWFTDYVALAFVGVAIVNPPFRGGCDLRYTEPIMTAYSDFGRLITAMITPFDADGEVNYAEAMTIADYLVENETDTILLSGTTGESPTLAHYEEFKLYETIVKGLKGRVPVLAGTGSNSTASAIMATQKAEQLGVQGSLQVVPYYNKPSQEGLYQHFKAIAAATKLPIILYNIPGRTSKNLEPETVARLADIPNIIGIKEAAGDIEQARRIRELTPDSFLMYSGDDALTCEFMAAGAHGVVSVASHVVGRQIKAMIQAVVDGHDGEASAVSARLQPLYKALFITTNPAPVKAAMRMLGFDVGKPRLPLVDVTDKEYKVIEDALDGVLGTGA